MATDLDILCMVAHPDDAEIHAGGVLIKLKDQGYGVGIVDFSRGEMGSRGTPEDRDRESAEAAAVMGVDVRFNLGFPDASIEATVKNRRRVVEAIRTYRPHLIITHDTTNRNPDHTHVSALVRESAFTAGLVRYDTGQPPHRPNKLIYTMEYFSSEPSFIVDITAEYDRKMAAIACHASQTYHPGATGAPTYIASEQFMRDMEARFRFFGARIHAGYGEGFRTDATLVVDDLVREIGMRGLIPGQGRSF